MGTGVNVAVGVNVGAGDGVAVAVGVGAAQAASRMMGRNKKVFFMASLFPRDCHFDEPLCGEEKSFGA